MGTAVIHIGMPKTGTTSIQALLHHNRDRLLAAGWHYPAFLKKRNHVALAVFAASSSQERTLRLAGLTSAEDHDQYRRDFGHRFVEHTRTGDWIFSSEHLGSRLFADASVDRLAGLFEHFDRVRILMYARRQDDMAVATYSTWLVDGRSDPFDVDFHVQHRNRYDFEMVADRWDRAFGRDAVEVRLYPPGDVCPDFAEAVGLGSISDWHRRRQLNSSLSSTEAAFVRQMNERLGRWDPEKRVPTRVVENFTDAFLGSGRGERLRMSSTDARHLLEAYESSNASTMERAANADRFPGYFDPPEDDFPGTVETDLAIDDALVLSQRLWKSTSRRLRGRGG